MILCGPFGCMDGVSAFWFLYGCIDVKMDHREPQKESVEIFILRTRQRRTKSKEVRAGYEGR